MTANQLAYWTLRETERANRVKENETQRHNKTSESIDWNKHLETERHNKAGEHIDWNEHLSKHSDRMIDQSIKLRKDERERDVHEATLPQKSAAATSEIIGKAGSSPVGMLAGLWNWVKYGFKNTNYGG